MLRVNPAREEPVRWLPMRVASLLNRLIGWTPDACAGGCGYPVTHRFTHEVEVIGDVRVIASICSTGGECERRVKADPRDSRGYSYADFRPEILLAIQAEPNLRVVRLSHTV